MNIFRLRRFPRYAKYGAGAVCIVILFLLVSRSSDTSNSISDVNSDAHFHRRRTNVETSYHAFRLGNLEPQEIQQREGPGEGGKPYFLAPEKVAHGQETFNTYGINMVVSNEIAMDRSIPDTRMEECKHWDYPEDLPKASVILVFHNEGFSTLMRTVHSVINRSPPQFLEEVILVDDFSSISDLKEQLDEYVKQFQGKVRVIRNAEREGLIRTRTNGAKHAKGEVILFLDAHCEVNVNWLPPLLAPIAKNRRTMTVPIIDGIDKDTLEYRPVYHGRSLFRGIFEWGMFYKETDIPPQEKKRHSYASEPYYSPTHAGGLFAMDRDYFLELGAYDPGLLVWGGENFELSFKIWQCGGEIVWVPCSRVGHIYRGFMPYNFGKLAQAKKGPLIINNYKRVIEVWFDDKHKEFFYTREPLARYLDVGDLSEQRALKERLGCKNFQWFMDNVAYDVIAKYPELPPNVHWGELRNIAVGACMDTMGRGPPAAMGVGVCHGQGNSQLMRLNAEGQLGVGERCVDVDAQGALKLIFCTMGRVDGPWVYDEETHTLMHRPHGKCAAVHPQGNSLQILPCSSVNTYQQWIFKQTVPNWR